jgi:hypothetical protein
MRRPSRAQLERRIQSIDAAIESVRTAQKRIPRSEDVELQAEQANRHAAFLVTWLDEIRWLARHELDPDLERYE